MNEDQDFQVGDKVEDPCNAIQNIQDARNKLGHLLSEVDFMSSEEISEVGGEIEIELRHALENIKIMTGK